MMEHGLATSSAREARSVEVAVSRSSNYNSSKAGSSPPYSAMRIGNAEEWIHESLSSMFLASSKAAPTKFEEGSALGASRMTSSGVDGPDPTFSSSALSTALALSWPVDLQE
jgi:hypothetical protein